MSYLENSIRLEKLIRTLPEQVRRVFGDVDLVTIAQNIGAKYELTFDEIDTLYSIIADALEKKPPGDVEEKIKAGLDEDTKPRGHEIARALVDDFFAKLETVWPGSKPVLKEPAPPVKPEALSSKLEGSVASPYAPVESPLGGNLEYRSSNIEKYQNIQGGNTEINTPQGNIEARSSKLEEKVPLDEKNIRALTRIAAGSGYSEQKLREAFEDLPTGLRQAISSVDTANAVQAIAKKYFLHVDQMASLASETGLVLLGLTHPASFILNLSKRLRIPEDKAKEIAREISGEILTKVRDSLRNLHDESPKTQALSSPPEALSSKQVPNTNVQRSVTLPATPLPPATFAPQNLKGQAKHSILAEQAAQKGLNTPYTPSAQWKTEAVGSGKSEAPSSPVGPTGWRPPAADGGKSQVSSFKFQGSVPSSTQFPKYPINKLETLAGSKPPVPAQSRPAEPVPPPQTALKLKPASDTPATFAPQNLKGQATPPAEETFLDQKMSGPMSLPKEERRYSSDPYREPLE